MKKILLPSLLLAGIIANAQEKRSKGDVPGDLALISYNQSDLLSTTKEYPVLKSPTANSLIGTYTVGASGTYTTLTAAIADLNSAPITGAVVFELLDSTYSTGETFPLVINENTGLSATNTLTIKPATGVNTTVSGAASGSAVIKINAADYVTIDGSNDGTGGKNLTIKNTATTGTNTCIWVASTSSAGADYVTIKNTNLIGQTNTATTAGLLSSGPTIGGAGTVPNNNLTIVNNVFKTAQNGLFLVGPTGLDQNTSVYNNTLGSTVAAEKLYYRGIAIQSANNFAVYNNSISGLSGAVPNVIAGILAGSTATNGAIYNNKISDVQNSQTAGYGAAGVFLNFSSAAANVTVYNNFISNVYAVGYNGAAAADNGNGIVVNNGGGFKIYNNSVNLTTNQTVTTGLPAAFLVTSNVTAAGAVDLRNNIFVNNQTTGTQRYAIYSAAANTVFSNINNNDYYSSGTNLGYLGSVRANLAAWQTATGKDANSVNIAPIFASATDLHLTTANTTLDNLGTPIAEVTVDIDGDSRNATTPDLGADEFTATTMAVSDVNRHNVSVYPNPFTEVLKISDVKGVKSISVNDVSGREVKTLAPAAELNLSNLKSGLYIVNLKMEDGSVKSFKAIKK